MKWRADAAIAAFLPALLAGCGPSADAPVPAAELTQTPRTATFVPTGTAPRLLGKIVPHYEATGSASWYGDELRGRRTASGEPFDPDAITAAHRSLPLLSHIEVTALDTGRSIIARVNDRGPFSNDRLVDLSHGAARLLGISGDGHARVRIRRVDAVAASSPNAAENRYGARKPETLPLREGVPRYVQVAAFASLGRARAMADRLGAHVDPAGAVYRVRFGPFTTDGAAKQALREAGAKGYPDSAILLDFVP